MFGIVKLLINNTTEQGVGGGWGRWEINNIEIYWLTFISKRHVRVRDQRRHQKFADYEPCSWC